MKPGYIVVMSLVAVAGVLFAALVVFSPLGTCSRLETAVQGGGMFVALLAATIALSSTDPKARRVKVDVEPSVDGTRYSEHYHSKLPADLRRHYQGCPDPFRSHRVHFRMTNTSGFTLVKPTFTFRVPLQRQHPYETAPGTYVRTFNSNLFNSQQDVRLLEFGDTRILSNSCLPYWNDQESITIWIRMVLDGSPLEPFDVEVSVNCDNAGGISRRVEIDPQQLMASSGHAPA